MIHTTDWMALMIDLRSHDGDPGDKQLGQATG